MGREIYYRDVEGSNGLNSILGEYGMQGKVTSISTQSKGFSTDIKSRIVVGETAFHLRCYGNKSEEDILSLVDLLAYLRLNGFPAPNISKTLKGFSYVTSPHGFYVMYEEVPGYVATESNALTDTQLQQAGALLAQYHLIASEYPNAKQVPITYHLDPDTVLPVVDSAMEILQGKLEKDDIDQTVLHIIDKKIRALQKLYTSSYNLQIPSLPKLQIHGDYHASNLVFDRHNTIVGILDWEDSSWWMRCGEVQAAVCMLTKIQNHEHFNIPIDFRRAKLFIDAYESVQPLTIEERQLMPYIAQIDALRLDFLFANRYLRYRSEIDSLFPRGEDEWFWWDNNLDSYTEQVLQL